MSSTAWTLGSQLSAICSVLWFTAASSRMENTPSTVMSKRTVMTTERIFQVIFRLANHLIHTPCSG